MVNATLSLRRNTLWPTAGRILKLADSSDTEGSTVMDVAQFVLIHIYPVFGWQCNFSERRRFSQRPSPSLTKETVNIFSQTVTSSPVGIPLIGFVVLSYIATANRNIVT